MNLQNIVIVIIAITGLSVVWLVLRIATRFSQIIDLQKKLNIKQIVIDEIIKIEEIASHRYNLDKILITSEKKLETAVMGIIAKTGLSKDEATDMVHAILPSMKIGAAVKPKDTIGKPPFIIPNNN